MVCTEAPSCPPPVPHPSIIRGLRRPSPHPCVPAPFAVSLCPCVPAPCTLWPCQNVYRGMATLRRHVAADEAHMMKRPSRNGERCLDEMHRICRLITGELRDSNKIRIGIPRQGLRQRWDIETELLGEHHAWGISCRHQRAGATSSLCSALLAHAYSVAWEMRSSHRGLYRKLLRGASTRALTHERIDYAAPVLQAGNMFTAKIGANVPLHHQQNADASFWKERLVGDSHGRREYSLSFAVT